MSTLNVENIKHIAADSDSLRLATDGTVTFTKNVTAVTADSATITNLSGTNVTGTNVTADSATITNLSGTNVTADSATITALSSTNVTASGDIKGSSFNGGQLGGRRNLIINGAMQVAQRGASSTGITGNDYYTVDRIVTTLNSMGTWTQTQESDAPDGFSKSIKMECTTADASPAAGDYLLVGCKLEGQDLQHLKKGTSSAESVTLSFWVKSNKTGTYIAEVMDQDNTSRHIGKSFTVNASGTWEYKTVTFEGDTTGTLDDNNETSLQLTIWLGSGTDFNSGTLQTSWGALSQTNRAVGNVNLADTIGNYFQITGLQLELGDTATPFEHRSYGEELALCQRYYQVIEFSVVGQQDAAFNTDHFSVLFNTMKAEPTLDVFTFNKQGHINGSLTDLGGATINYYDNAVQFVWSSTDSKYRNYGYRVIGSMSLEAEL